MSKRIHLCDMKDGHGRWFYIAKEIEIVEKCPNIFNCWITSDGNHTQELSNGHGLISIEDHIYFPYSEIYMKEN